MKFFGYIDYVPLFLIVLILYNIFAFIGVDLEFTANPLFQMPLPSGAQWTPTWSGVFILIGVVTLFFEILKSTKTGSSTLVEHSFSMIVFIVMLIEFLLVKQAGTSTFLILTLMSLLDVVAGFTISIVTARRDFTMMGGGGG
jgi:hypothetical protein